MRWLVRAGVAVAVVYAGIVALFLANRHALIYPFDLEPIQVADVPRAKEVTLPASGEDPALTVWMAPALRDRPTIIYFMGNSGNLSGHAPKLKEMTLQGYGLAAMSYRGGSGQPGAPSEEAIARDARRLWDGLDALSGRTIPAGDRVIFGLSLGSGVATRLASEVSGERALILEAPFTRLCDAAEAAYPLLPACLTMWDERYDSQSRITAIDAPLLILHGTEDATIPVELGQALFDAAAEPKEIRIYEGGHHSDLRLFGAGIDAMAYLEGLSAPRN